MSKLLKSKFLVGIMLVAVLAVGAFALATTASAQQAIITVSDVQYAATVQLGSSGQAALIWQRFLNGYSTTAQLVEDGKFGPLSVAQAKAWQSSRGLSADGVLGAMSRAAAMAQISMNAPASAFAAGCTSYSGYSTSTGLSCAQNIPASYPAGCSSNSGFSVTTGQSCAVSTSLPAGCSSTVGYSPTTGAKCDGGSVASGPLAGGAGSITVDDLPTYASEEVGEGEEDVKVLAFEVEAEGSDVEISSVKVEFVESGATSSEDLDDYAQSVSVWFDGEKVGEADVSDFSESSTEVWTRSIALDAGVIIQEDDTEVLEVAVTANNTIDSGDSNSDLWTVDILNVRFEDGEGVVTTEDTDGDALEQTFDFAEFATAADIELKVSLGDEDINDAHVINVHATAETDNVELLSFELEAEGNSDITLNDLSVNFDTVGVDLEDAVTTVTLWANGTQIGTESITKNTATPGTDETIEFDQLNFTIDAGDTVEFIVKADLESIADGIADTDTISAQISATERALIEAEDEAGNDVDAGDMTGTAVGDAHAMYDAGIMVEFVSATATRSFTGDAAGEDDIGEYVITFDVTAFDGIAYLDRHVDDQDTIGDAGEGVEYNVTSTAGTPVASSELLDSSSTDADDTADVFQVEEDATRRFTVNVILTADAATDGSHQVLLESIGWGTVVTDATNDNNYIFNLGDFKTPSLFLNDM